MLIIRAFSGQLVLCDIPQLRIRKVNKVGIVETYFSRNYQKELMLLTHSNIWYHEKVTYWLLLYFLTIKFLKLIFFYSEILQYSYFQTADS